MKHVKRNLRSPATRVSPMRRFLLWITPFLLGPALLTSVYAQSGDKQLTEADYLRAERFASWNLSDRIHRTSVDPEWIDDDRFWYRISIPKGHQFIYVDPDQQLREPAFDHERLASALSESAEGTFEPYDLPFRAFEYTAGRQAITFTFDNSRWNCVITGAEYQCEGPEDPPDRIPGGITSPDGTKQAYIREHDLWVRDLETGEDIRLTEDGTERYGYAKDSQGWRRSGMPVLVWSPDSRRIATYRLDEREVKDMHLLRTDVGRPELESWPYALPGDDEVPMHERVVLDVETREKVWLDTDPDHQRTSNCCGLTRGQQWADVEWNDDGEQLAFVSTSRDYKTVTLQVADPVTGDVRTVYEETADTFFESNLQSRGVPNWRVFHDTNEFLWFTRRDGWGHLYLYDLQTGELKNRITSGAWNVMDIKEIDHDNRTITFTGVGREEDRDPYFRHLYRINMDGSGMQLLTPEDANHDLDLSPSGRYMVDNYSTPDTEPRSVLRSRDGEVVMQLEESSFEHLEEIGWRPPEPFTVKARDGKTDIYGLLYKPSDFDPDKNYPIINAIYPGPQSGSVGSRSFSISRRGQAFALAELGFIVVQIDALGSSPERSKSFHTHYYGDMSDNGLEDQKAGMKQLADRYDWIDLDRVGIVGHSGGGFATASALFQHPEFFHVGVSSAGNHDNRGYTYYWGEKYQGQLEEGRSGDNFENQANQLQAENLEGDLLISYGTMDSNVHPNMTLQVIDELIRHNKDFDVMVMPNRGHGYSGESYKIRRTWDYFVRNLLGKEPPEEYQLRR